MQAGALNTTYEQLCEHVEQNAGDEKRNGNRNRDLHAGQQICDDPRQQPCNRFARTRQCARNSRGSTRCQESDRGQHREQYVRRSSTRGHRWYLGPLTAVAQLVDEASGHTRCPKRGGRRNSHRQAAQRLKSEGKTKRQGFGIDERWRYANTQRQRESQSNAKGNGAQPKRGHDERTR